MTSDADNGFVIAECFDSGGPFMSAAHEARSNGLAPIPCGGADGKTAYIRGFTSWTHPPSQKVLGEWSARFGSDNIAVVTGHVSKLVTVDVDDNTVLSRAREAFGATPVEIRSPRGGHHLAYRYVEPIGCLNLRAVGAAIDVKGDGGYVVAPPSVRPDTGRRYEFVLGSWPDFLNLPPFRMSGLESFGYRLEELRSEAIRGDLIEEGQRNIHLFEHLRRLAPFISLDAVLDEARHYNQTQNAAPEDDAKIAATAKKVFDYQHRGTLKRPAEAYVRVTHEVLDHIKQFAGDRYTDALALYIELQRQHGARARVGAPFALAVEPMAQKRVVHGMKDRRRYEHARDALIAAGFLRLISPAGKDWGGMRRPAFFVLVHPSAVAAGNSKDIHPKALAPNNEQRTGGA